MAVSSIAPRMVTRYALQALLAVVVLVSGSRQAWCQTQDDFFDDSVLQEVRLVVSTRDWNTLKTNFEDNTYYAADLTWRNITVRNVGIRSRGNGTRNGVKPGLRVDMNRYLSNQEFLGLKAFELKNMYTDPTLLRETLAMKFYSRIGLAAPREAHVRVYVNNEYVGAYVIVESIDRPFLSRAFGPPEAEVETGGYLFEYKWTFPYGFEYLGADLKAYAPLFEPQTRETDAIASIYGPIEAMIRNINESTDEDFLGSVGGFIDLQLLMKYLAVELFTVEWDGLTGNWATNNFYMYRFRQTTRSQLIPWDRDHAFTWDNEHAADFLAAPVTLRLDTNVLTRRAMSVPSLRQAFFDALEQCSDMARQPAADDPRGWLEREVDRQLRQIATAVSEDPNFPFPLDAFQADVDFLFDFARKRPALVDCQVLQLTAGSGDGQGCSPVIP